MKIIQMIRHQKSIDDNVRGKIPSPEGIANSYRRGYESAGAYDNLIFPHMVVRGYHSSAERTQLSLRAHLMGFGKGTMRHLPELDHVDPPKEAKDLRKEVGDKECMRLNLSRYDVGGARLNVSPEMSGYYYKLFLKGNSIAEFIDEEFLEAPTELIICYGHEPTLSMSLIEIAKRHLDYDGSNNVQFFAGLVHTNENRFLEGTGYEVRVSIEGKRIRSELVTEGGSFELK